MRPIHLLASLAFTLGGCLGPAPWADWESSAPAADGGSTGYAAPRGEVRYAPAADIETSALAPPPGASASTAPFTRVESRDEATVQSGVGGPYAPTDIDPAGRGVQPLGTTQAPPPPLELRTLPLMMTGTGAKAS